MSETMTITHQRGPNFASGVATGITIAGPSGDGMVHLTFFRDVISITSETFAKIDVSSPTGSATGFQLTAIENGAGPESRLFREDLAVVSLPVEAAKGLSAWLNNHFAAQGPQ